MLCSGASPAHESRRLGKRRGLGLKNEAGPGTSQRQERRILTDVGNHQKRRIGSAERLHITRAGDSRKQDLERRIQNADAPKP
jgi:hypothetical protein